MTITRGGVEDTRLEAKDTKKIRGQGQGQPFRGQTLSRPRTGMLKDTSASALQKQTKKGHHKNFSGDLKKKIFFKRSPQKNVFQEIFQALHKILTIQKIVLPSSRGQANFRGLEASRPRPRLRTSKCVLEDSTSDYYSRCIFTGSAAKNEFDSGKKIFIGISTRAELSSIVRLPFVASN